MKIFSTLAVLSASLCAATPVLAHADPSGSGAFLSGLTHPVFGLDHVLAMVATGLWAATLGERANWALPAGFLCAMFAGFALAMAGIPLPLVEPMILASSIFIGALVASALRPDPRLATFLVALFALFHGHAHGAEWGQAKALLFGIGFVLATAILIASGAALGRLLEQQRLMRRLLGGVIALTGAVLTFA